MYPVTYGWPIKDILIGDKSSADQSPSVLMRYKDSDLPFIEKSIKDICREVTF